MISKVVSRRFRVFIPSIAIFFSGSLPTYAQVAGGTILGTVTDASGGAVANAEIAVTDKATGVVRTFTTNAAGFYSAPNLVPGPYEVKATAAGFAPAVTDLTLTVGAQQSLNFTLKVGSATASIEVSSAPPSIELATSTLSGEVEGETVRELPLNGRDWTQLATLEPGVNSIRNQATVGSNGTSDATKATRGFGNQLSVSGTRSSQNNYRLDGISINDYTNDAPGGVMGTLSGVDAIQEFSVLTTNYTAEYGKTSGGVINAITRSGTNQFHGGAYEFLRNSALDARNFFDGPTVPPFKRNQFGAAIGGPIRKDKTFFFFDWERVRQLLDVTQFANVPSANARMGILSTGNVPVNPNIVPYLAFYPARNDGKTTGDTGQFSAATLQNGTQNFYTTRIDQKISAKDSLAGTFLYDQSSLSQPDALDVEHFDEHNRRVFVSLEETHTFSSALANSVRFGFSRNGAATLTAEPVNPLAADLSLGTNPGRPAPELFVPTLAPFFGGIGGFPYFTFGWNSFQGYDDAFLTRGAHSLKFGFAVERMQSNNLFTIDANGSVRFGSLGDFLQDIPASFATYVGIPTPRGIRQTLYGGYIQDDWRFRSNLTLNLGLRYEMTTVPTEVQGKLATLRNITDTVVHIGDPYFNNPTLKDFEPRVGFAWDPFHSGKTSIRGGAGMFDVLPLPYEFLIISSNADAPFSANTSISPATPAPNNVATGDFPANLYPKAFNTYVPGTIINQRVGYVQPNPPRSYVTEWNLSIQREIVPHVTAIVAYVGSSGVHLPDRTDDSDMVLPTKTAAGWLWPSPAGSGTEFNSTVGRIDRLDWSAKSDYHALEAGLKMTPLHGVSLEGSFTWGKSIDTSSATIGGDQYTNSPSSLPVWFDPATRRAQSDFNLGKVLVMNGMWQVPGTHDSGPASWALNGWQLGSIFQVSSGAPFTVLVGGDPLGMNNTDPFAYPNRITTGACSSQVNSGNPNNYVKLQCFAPANPLNLLGNSGRNPLNGPGLVNVDFSVFKNNRIPRISETFNVQFRAEFFNIFNKANFAPPNDNNTLFNQDGSPASNAGVIDGTTTTSRQIQFGLKVIF
jgi:Carboxypeptidase regulatory-like domain/TonB dependent receptor/TonB-dependent Receptor Plug Domain